MNFKAFIFCLLAPLLAFAQVEVRVPGASVSVGAGIRYDAPAFDADALAYFTRASVTDATAKSQINAFVRGVKALGVWNNSVFWLMRSSQNAGSGTVAYSLGGLETNNGTLVNGPTWGASGITTGATSYITASYSRNVLATPLTMFATYTGLTPGNNQAYVAISSTASGTPLVWLDSMPSSTVNLRGFQRNDASANTFTGTTFLSANGSSLADQNTTLVPSSGMVMRSHTWAGTEGVHTLNNITCGGALRTTFGVPAAATYSVFGYMTTNLTNAQITTFYSLIKSTIGTGLSLP